MLLHLIPLSRASWHEEFAFSVDNLCPLAIVPWFTLVDDDLETLRLAELSRVLLSEPGFSRRLHEVGDRLGEEHRLSPRGKDGYYGEVDPSLGAVETWDPAQAIIRSLDEELAPAAIDVLRASGHEAWVNDVGHVAVGMS